MTGLFTRFLLPCVLVSTLPAVPSQAQPSQIGAELQVNQQTSGYQNAAAVTAAPDGGFLVVWEDEASNRLVARRLTAEGAPSGDERPVVTGLTAPPLDPSVSPLGAGAFLVAWRSPAGALPGDGDGSAIAARRLGADGTSVGDIFQLNVQTSGDQITPRLAIGATGGVAVWTSDSSPANDDDGTSIVGRRFSADGAPLASDFQVNLQTSGDQLSAAAAAGGDDFVVVWNDGGRVAARRLDAGQPAGAEHEIAVGPALSAPAVTALEDGFVAVWRDAAADSLEARLLDPTGQPTGPAFRLDPPGLQTPREPAVARLDTGFAVVWTGYGGLDGDPDDAILGQILDGDGRASGAAFQVNTHTTETQYRPRLATQNGRFVVVWTTYGGTGNDTDYAIAARPFEQPFFSDGFESGDFKAWPNATSLID